MSAIYDNWERLVDAVLKKQQLWELFHARSPSVVSEASEFSSFSNLSNRIHDYAFDISRPEGSSRLAPKPRVTFSDFSPVFGFEDLLLSSVELLGRGTFGSSYTALMENGLKVVLKRVSSLGVSEQDFRHHMEIVRDISHENVVPVRDYYPNKRLILYDHYTNGSVFSLLHGQISEIRDLVDWETRLKIAIGAAKGIAEIHRQNGGKFVHGNIKSSNVFLNSKNYGCVSDLGLTSMMPKTFMPIAHCYAPEVKSTPNVSQASDVYGFGVLLLELLTRKTSTYVHGGPKAIDLVQLVNSVKHMMRASHVFDTDLLEQHTIGLDMVALLQIGISCTVKSIKERPKMSEVVNMLEDLSSVNLSSFASMDGNFVFSVKYNSVFNLDNMLKASAEEFGKRTFGPSYKATLKGLSVDDDNPTFDVKDLLGASAEALGRGTFGASYKATLLGNGKTVVVKRLKDVIVKLKDFQHHMEVIGRIKHENLAAVRAYCFSGDEQLVVRDYYQDSVSALLHGTFGTVRTNLGWKARLKIAMGAAWGIAHVHRQDGGTFVHGNIKSSNIFLNEQKYGIVTDFGMAKLTSPVSLYSVYIAPEVTNIWKVSQASDVYSYGVLLLELISGIPLRRMTNSILEQIQSDSVVLDEWVAQVCDKKFLRYQIDKETMVELLKIAISCVSIVPECRPRMYAVVVKISVISSMVGISDC